MFGVGVGLGLDFISSDRLSIFVDFEDVIADLTSHGQTSLEVSSFSNINGSTVFGISSIIGAMVGKGVMISFSSIICVFCKASTSTKSGSHE